MSASAVMRTSVLLRNLPPSFLPRPPHPMTPRPSDELASEPKAIADGTINSPAPAAAVVLTKSRRGSDCLSPVEWGVVPCSKIGVVGGFFISFLPVDAIDDGLARPQQGPPCCYAFDGLLTALACHNRLIT